MTGRLSQLLSGFDRLPYGGALAGGTLLGGAAGVLALLLGPWGLVAVAVVGLLAGAVAWTGQPVGVWEETINDVLDMVEIEGGTFLMGSPEDEKGRFDRERQHEVTVSPFLMSRTTVTRAEYREALGLEEAPGPGTDDHPVTEVSWYDAVQYCNRLSEQAGLKPCYRIRGRKVKWARDTGYRLPTEAEWEYAARADTQTRWSFGDDEASLGEHAWFSGNSGFEPHPVAILKPNPLGLYDIHGNVWEWCWDRFANYSRWRRKDPRGPVLASSALRVLRGGSFYLEPRDLRSAFRDGNEPENRGRVIGFRCVRRPGRQP